MAAALTGFLNAPMKIAPVQGAITSLNGIDVANVSFNTPQAQAMNTMSGVQQKVSGGLNVDNIILQAKNVATQIADGAKDIFR